MYVLINTTYDSNKQLQMNWFHLVIEYVCWLCDTSYMNIYLISLITSVSGKLCNQSICFDFPNELRKTK